MQSVYTYVDKISHAMSNNKKKLKEAWNLIEHWLLRAQQREKKACEERDLRERRRTETRKSMATQIIECWRAMKKRLSYKVACNKKRKFNTSMDEKEEERQRRQRISRTLVSEIVLSWEGGRDTNTLDVKRVKIAIATDHVNMPRMIILVRIEATGRI